MIRYIVLFVVVFRVAGAFAQDVPPDDDVELPPPSVLFFAFGVGLGGGDAGAEYGPVAQLSGRLGILLSNGIVVSAAARPMTSAQGGTSEEESSSLEYNRMLLELGYYIGPETSFSHLTRLLVAGGIERNERGVAPYASASYSLLGVPIVAGWSVRGTLGPGITRLELVLELIPLTILPLPF